MRITPNKAKTIRAGQTIYRILARYTRVRNSIWEVYPLKEPVLQVYVHEHYVSGKKQWSNLGGGRSAFFEPKRAQVEKVIDRIIYREMHGRHYVNDLVLHGNGAFTRRREAERFAQQIRDGLHPQITKRALEWFRDMEIMDEAERAYEAMSREEEENEAQQALVEEDKGAFHIAENIPFHIAEDILDEELRDAMDQAAAWQEREMIEAGIDPATRMPFLPPDRGCTYD